MVNQTSGSGGPKDPVTVSTAIDSTASDSVATDTIESDSIAKYTIPSDSIPSDSIHMDSIRAAIPVDSVASVFYDRTTVSLIGL